eukprot:gene24191-44876_t
MKTTHGGDIVNPEAPLERIDAESGLPVYKAHLLKVGEGGDSSTNQDTTVDIKL